MNEKQTFIENDFKFLAIMISSVLLLVLAIWAVVAFLNRQHFTFDIFDKFNLFFFLIPVVLICILWIAASFQKKKIITCGDNDCEIYEKNFWNKAKLTNRFAWRDVERTTFYVAGRNIYCFSVYVNGKENSLVSDGSSSKEEFDRFVALANQATAHLPYFWIRSKDVGNLPILGKAGNFSRISRV